MNTAFSRISANVSRNNREKYYALNLGYSSGELGDLGLYIDSFLTNDVRDSLSGVKIKNDGKFRVVSAIFDAFNLRGSDSSAKTFAVVNIGVQYAKPSMIPVDPAEIDAIVLEKLQAALKLTLEKIRIEVLRRENDEKAGCVANAVNAKIAELAREKCGYSAKIAALREELKVAKESLSEEVWHAAYEKYGAEVCDIARTKKPDSFSSGIELFGD